MANRNADRRTGKALNVRWKVGAQHALYRQDGKWYHHLNRFPGALFDRNGYLLFETQEQFDDCPFLQRGGDLHVPAGISAIPGYRKVVVSGDEPPVEPDTNQRRDHPRRSPRARARDPMANATNVQNTALVLVENETTVGQQYDNWKDATGERYHFPNQYRSRVIPGRLFVYYRGVRRKSHSRGRPEYFGVGRIGDVWRDSDVPEAAKKRNWKWFCNIEEYEPFSVVVSAKLDGQYLEQIPSNFWGVGVRELPFEIFERIVEIGLSRPIGALRPADTSAVPLEVQRRLIVTDESLLRLRSPPVVHEQDPSAALTSPRFSPRRSRFANEIGRAAEEIVFRYFRSLPDSESISQLAWVSLEGKQPGWDIEFRRRGEFVAIEVKGTTGSQFVSVDLSANEWTAAERLGPAYWLCLVVDCLDNCPRMHMIRDPVALVRSGVAAVSPALWRFELVRPEPS